MKTLTGKVTGGLGEFYEWFPKLQPYFSKKLGMRFFPGCLRVFLDDEYRHAKGEKRIEKDEYGGTMSINIVPCRIFETNAFILQADLEDIKDKLYLDLFLEVACDIKLREKYKLKNRDRVEVEVME